MACEALRPEVDGVVILACEGLGKNSQSSCGRVKAGCATMAADCKARLLLLSYSSIRSSHLGLERRIGTALLTYSRRVPT